MRPPVSAPYSRFFDGMAMGVSGLCVVHCLALPLAVLILPNVSLLSRWPEALHLVAACLATASSAAAIAPRWPLLSPAMKRQIGGSAAIGIALLWLALALHSAWAETSLTVLGSCFLVYAHLANIKR